MSAFILAEKQHSSQMFDEAGKRVPVTTLKTTQCYLIDFKMPETNGYCSVKLGFGQMKNIDKPTKGQLEKAGIKTPLRFLKEIRLKKTADKVKAIEEEGKKGIAIGEAKLFIGEEIKPAVLFKVGDLVDVSGISKGKGFQGVVKRHGFAGGPKTHGQSDRLRAPGSMGQTTTPGHTYKGKRMAGRMGNDRITVQNLKVLEINEEGLKVKGLIPGSRESVVEVRIHAI